MRIPLLLSTLLVLILSACNQEKPADYRTGIADARSATLVDEAVAAMGGWKAWDQARYFTFNFFGNRDWTFDKHEQRYRVEFNSPKVVVTGKLGDPSSIQANSVPPGQVPVAVEQYAREAEQFWRNDSYWLFMPFKLRDPGVTLTYEGEGTTKDGKSAHLVAATFDKVGDTPENKYIIYFDQETKLVSQWDYYGNSKAGKVTIRTPWSNYITTDCGLKLSTDRGDRKLSNVACLETIDKSLFAQ